MFTGNDNASLLEFLNHFDALTQASSLLEDEQCQYILRYVDCRTKQPWLTLNGYELHDYQKLKGEIVYQYLVALKATQWHPAQLVCHHMP